MVSRDELVTFLDNLLAISDIKGDRSSNGLQVEGAEHITKVIGAVDACQATYRATVDAQGQFVFVHHGEFWSSIDSMRGRVAERFRLMFKNDLSLYAAHLPLDAHPALGHNAEIARMLQLQDAQPFAQYCGAEIGFWGSLPQPLSTQGLAELLDQQLDTTSVVHGPASTISKVGIVSGGGASALEECMELGIDCLVTGEVNHTWYHPILELGIPMITSGHYKTEVPGVLAVLKEIEKAFDVETEFIDIPTGL